MNKKVLFFIALLSTVSSNVFADERGSWQLQALLSQNIPGAQEGISVAVSADGNILAVGAWFLKNAAGATQVYVRSGTAWRHQATLSQNRAEAQEGVSVTLSADGSFLVASSLFGEVVYKRSGSQWHPIALIEGQLDAVALSSNATVLAVGDTGYDYSGGTSIFVRSGNTWKYETTVTQDVSQSYEGCSVALSAHGNLLAVGAFADGPLSGATQIYVKSGNGWHYETTLSQNMMQASEGISVALSADGKTLAAGADMYGAAGGTMIYVRSGNVWQLQTILSQNSIASYEGSSVALSADGNTLAAGAPKYSSSNGAVHIYTRNNNVWQYEATLTQASQSQIGTSVALSSNATTLVTGAPFSSGGGQTFVYVE